MAGDTKSIVAAVAEVNDLKEAISDLKKEIDEALESLNNFGRVGSLSVRNLGTEARSLQSTFRDLSRDLRRTTTPSGTIGAAATSQALGTLTGGGRVGRVGGGGGGGGHAGQYGSSMGLGGRAGEMIGKGIAGTGGMLGNIIGSVFPSLGKLVGGATKKLGAAGAFVSSAGLTSGIGFLEKSTQRHTELERAGMGFGGWQQNLPKKLGMDADWLTRARGGSTAGLNKTMATGARFGFNVEEQLQTAFPLLPLAGPRDRGRQRLQKFVSKTLLPATTSAGVGVDAGTLSDFTGTVREAGQGFGTATRMIRGARAAFGAGNARETVGLLSAIKSSLGILINVTGRATKGQVEGAAQLHQGIRRHTGYEPGVSASLAAQLHQAGISPGGGEAGQVAMLQTMGFGMPNLGYQQNLAKQMGMKKTDRFGKKRGYLQAMLAMKKQSGSQATQSLLLTARRIAGEDPLHQAQVLTQLVPGLQLPKALDLTRGKGGKTLARRVGEAFTRGKDFTKEGKEDAPTQRYQASIPLIKEHMKLVHLSLSADKEKLATITKAMTELKVSVLEPTTKLLLALPKVVEESIVVIDNSINALKKAFQEFIDLAKKGTQPRTGPE